MEGHWCLLSLEILPLGLAPRKACSLQRRHGLSLEPSFTVPHWAEGIRRTSDSEQQPLTCEGHCVCHTSELFLYQDLCSEAKHVAFAHSGASGGVPFPKHSQSSPPAVPALMTSYQVQPSLGILYKINLLSQDPYPLSRNVFFSLAFSPSVTLYSYYFICPAYFSPH